MVNISRIAAPSPPELEFWRGRGLQTPTGPRDRDFGSSLSLQDKLVERPNTSSTHRAAFMAIKQPTIKSLARQSIGAMTPWEASKMMDVSGIAAHTLPEHEFWKGRGLQTPTGPRDRDFGSSLSLQDKLVELPSTSSSHRTLSKALILSLHTTRIAPS